MGRRNAPDHSPSKAVESRASRSTQSIAPLSSPQGLLQRAQADPGSLTHTDIQQLQRSIGNRATGRLLAQSLSAQTKLQVGPANDTYEAEADRTAQQVMRTLAAPAPPVQREEDEGGPVVGSSRFASSIADLHRSRDLPSPSRTFVKPKVQREEMNEELMQAAPLHGLEGGDVEANVAQTIQRAKGGGDTLDAKTRNEMEGAFGAYFGGVRIHTGSQSDTLNRSLNAKAFTTGSDIFFGKGQYSPGSTGGQELIAHELTHTVQQGAAPVQRQESALPAVSGISKKNPSIQRVESDVFITGTSHLVKMVGGTIQGGKEDQEIIHGQQLTIDTDTGINSRRGPNQEEFAAIDQSGPQHYKWYKVVSIEGKKAPKDVYIRQDVFVYAKKESGTSKLDQANEFVEAVTSVPATLIGNEGVTGVADALNDKTVFTNTGGGVDTEGNATASQSDLSHAKNMGIAGDSITGITGLLGMAKGFKDLGNPEQTASETFVTFLEIEQGAMKTGESVSKLVNTLGEGGASGTMAKGLGSGFEGYGAAFGGIKEGFLAMKGFVELIRDHQDYSTEEKARKAAEIGLHALEGAKSVVLSIKSFIELVEGSASGGLMAAVPGLDIAISAVRIIMDGYYLAISNASRRVMNERRRGIAAEKNVDKDKLTSASEFYRTKDAEIANLKEVIKDAKARLAKKPKKDASRLKKRIVESEAKILLLEKEVAADNISREAVAEFSLVTELRDANTKRVTRQSIHIANEMVKIAGSIATLTGVGAMGGAITKGAAAAVDLSLPAARLAKQAGRDRAGRKMAKGKKDKSIGVFDHTKSTAAKSDFRLKQVKYLIRLIVDLAYETDTEARETRATHINSYLKAAGVSKTKLFKKNGDPQAQINMLVAAIQQREFM